MQTVNISEFRGNLLDYLTQAHKGETFTVQSSGKPLATVTPMQDQQASAKQALRKLAESAEIGDILSPVNADWHAMQ